MIDVRKFCYQTFIKIFPYLTVKSSTVRSMATTIELADGVYRIATDNYCLNTGLILGLEKALVIDTGAGPRQATEIYDEVRRITRMPLVVVNTHAHPERYFGNGRFLRLWAPKSFGRTHGRRALSRNTEIGSACTWRP